MIDGYLKVAAITPNVRVADVEFNCNEICKCIKEAAGKKVKLMVFPELCITGYTCQDLFFHNLPSFHPKYCLEIYFPLRTEEAVMIPFPCKFSLTCVK